MIDKDNYIIEIMNRKGDVPQSSPDGFIKINVLLDFLQDAAGTNAQRLGVGNLLKDGKDLRWILLDYDIKINRMPLCAENVIVRTWPSDEISLYAIRDFKILSDKGEELVLATSRWVMMDLVRMRPVVFHKEIKSLPINNERSIVSDFTKINPLEEFDLYQDIKPRYMEIDANKHVNNAVYATWMYDCLPADFLEHKKLSSLKISYKAGIPYNASAKLLTKINNDGSTCHDILNAENSAPAAFIRATWQDR